MKEQYIQIQSFLTHTPIRTLYVHLDANMVFLRHANLPVYIQVNECVIICIYRDARHDNRKITRRCELRDFFVARHSIIAPRQNRDSRAIRKRYDAI